jgi:Domain of unknown function (DUF4371)
MSSQIVHCIAYNVNISGLTQTASSSSCSSTDVTLPHCELQLTAAESSNSNVSCSDNLSSATQGTLTPVIEFDEQPQAAVEHSDLRWPNIWNAGQVEQFKSTNEWLFAGNDSIGCGLCREAIAVGVHTVGGVSVSIPWAKGLVTYYGDGRAEQLRSLRKKICDHKNSETHQAIDKLLSIRQRDILPSSLSNASHKQISNTCKVFNTCYYLIKQERPFADLPHLIDMQVANGLDMGVLLQSRVTAGEICEFIGTTMRQKLIANLLQSKTRLSVMVDEATTSSSKTALSVCLKAFLCGQPTTFFLDLVELKSTNSDAIFTAIESCLTSHKLTTTVLKERLICFASDGASVMLGRSTGVAQQMLDKYPNIVTWHCANHRLELAVHDAVSDVGAINHFKIFLDQLYCLYSSSPKNKYELEAAAESVGAQFKRIGRLLDTRWVASSFRTVNAVLTSYKGLHQHFSCAVSDTARDSRDKAKYRGLINIFTSCNFVLNTGIMADALQELSDLSTTLQLRTMSIVMAHRKIHQLISVFEARKSHPGKFYTEISNAVEKGNYQEVDLSQNKKVPIIEPKQFYQSLADNIRTRLLTTACSRGQTATTTSLRETNYNQLMSDLELLTPNLRSKEFTIVSGDAAMGRLSRRFNIDEKNVVDGFRDFVSSMSDTPPSGLNQLTEAVDTLVVSTAECERSFSIMNDICTDNRSLLGIRRTGALMFAKLMGPRHFSPELYAHKWIDSGRHSADDTASRKREMDSVPADSYSHISHLF